MGREPAVVGFLVDEGYSGIGVFMRAVFYRKKPQNGHTSRIEQAGKDSVLSDRDLTRTLYDEMCGLWAIMSVKWRSGYFVYDNYVKICIAMENRHIPMNPLQSVELNNHSRIRKHLIDMGFSTAQKREQV